MIKPVWTGRVAAVRWARASMLVLAIGLGSGAASAQLTDAQLMDSVQVHALKYFWDHAHPTSKLSRERIHLDNLAWDENTIAIGGTGFGFLNVIVGIENGHISATEGVTHLNTALDFLWNADRFHGAWPHWMEGNTGAVIPFSTFDDGGDLVETALLCQALICVREYFKDGNAAEQVVANKADVLWKGVEWSWYTQGEESLMFRVQYKPGKTWCFLCKPCVNEVKPDNPQYRYGGTWKG